MLLKICYKPNGFYYVKDVSSVDFSSHVDTNISADLQNGFLFVDNKPMNGNLMWCDEFVTKELGVAQHEEDGKWYINNVSFITPEGEQFIAFTGYAYLCDDNGKTIDVMK